MTTFKPARCRGVRAAVFAIAVFTTAAADAAHYDISGGIAFEVPSTVLLDSYSVVGSTSVSRQVLYDAVQPNRSWHGRAGSGADGFGLHSSVYVGGSNIANGDSGGVAFTATATVLVSFTDFMILGPAGSGPVQTPVNFHLSGEQILGSYTSMSPIYTSDVQSSVFLQIFAGNNGASGARNFDYRNGVSSPPTHSGLLENFNGLSANVQTPLWTLPVNTPFTLTMQLSTSVRAGVVFSDGYVTSALSDFGNTLSFATDRPVFGLPAGYSVSSTDAGIVDNVFTSPVPEPGRAALAAFGLACVGACAWARRRRGFQAPALLRGTRPIR